MRGPRGGWRCRGEHRRSAGSAAVEFVLMAPFVLVLGAFVWDLRAYISHRTDLAREVYVLAQVIADEADKVDNRNPIRRTNNPNSPGLIDAFIARFESRGAAGTLDIAVVGRGTTDRGSSDCADASVWCPPEVIQRWPTTPADGRWAGGGACVLATSGLPDQGMSFAANEVVLPNENERQPNEDTWISRRIAPDGWWVVVDVCLHPGPGLFTGPLIQSGFDLAKGMLDLGGTGYRFSLRGAWRSIHNRGSCDWCDP